MTVSVIVPAFNVDAYVTACLESLRAAVRAAPGPSCEVLCVNDGSTDGTARLLDDFRERAGDDPCFRVRVWHLPNRGVAAARTFALEKAVGSWFAFVDADDLVSPDCFSSFLAGLSAYPDADLVRVGTSPFEDGTLPAWSGTGCVSLLDIRADLPAPLTMFGFTEMLYRASKFRDLRFEEFRVGEDIVFSARCFARADSIAVVDRTAYGYRIRSGSRMHGAPSVARVKGQIDYLAAMFGVLASSGKSLSSAFTRSRGNVWFENTPAQLLSRPLDPEWRHCWRYWLDSLATARTMRFFSPWQRFVVRVLSATRSRLAALFLCIVPYLLKKGGFHR